MKFLRAFPIILLIAATFSTALADIPAPKTEPAGSVDWTYILTGCLCAIAGALICVWIGRRLFKRQ